VVKKITTESDAQAGEADDHGVLAEAGLDTTAIGILSPHTSQVRVVMPQGFEEPDDEVIDDELDPGDIRNGEIVIELSDRDFPAGAEDGSDDATDDGAAEPDAAEDRALTGEIDDDVVDAVREHAAAHTDPEPSDDVIDVVVVQDAAPAAVGDDDAALEDDVDAEDDAPVADTHEDDAHEDEAHEDEDEAEQAEGAPVADAPHVDGWRAAAAELAREHASVEPVRDDEPEPDPQPEIEPEPEPQAEIEPEPEPEIEPETESEPEDAAHVEADDASHDEAGDRPEATGIEKSKSYARIWAEESAAHRAASTEIDTPTQTNGAITMTARRLEDLGKNAERESSDLLTADRVLNPNRVAKAAPEGAWSEFVYGLTGGRLNLGDSRKVRARKAIEARVAAPLSGATRFVPILSRKGGVGKTTVTTLLGMALADGRDDRVIAIDANPDRGTLADRIGKRTDKTVRDLVHKARDIRGFNDISRYVARDETRLDVLASDPDPRIAEAFGEDDYRTVADVAEHFYSLVLTDTGTGIIHSVMGATLSHADQLIIVTGLNLDEVRLASETLTWLESNGYDDLARQAIVVLNQQSEATPMVRLNELEVHFGSRVRSVVHLPYDRALATGAAIVYRDLQPATRDAARDLAARVVDGLRQDRTA